MNCFTNYIFSSQGGNKRKKGKYSANQWIFIRRYFPSWGVCSFSVLHNQLYKLPAHFPFTVHIARRDKQSFFSISGLRCRSIFAIQKPENEIFVLHITKKREKKKRSHNPVILNCPFLSSVFFLNFFFLVSLWANNFCPAT